MKHKWSDSIIKNNTSLTQANIQLVSYWLGPVLLSLQKVFERLATDGGGVAILRTGLLVTLEDLLLFPVILDAKVAEGVGLVPLPVASPTGRPDSLIGDLVALRPMTAPFDRVMIFPFLTSICLLGSVLFALGVLGVWEPLSECNCGDGWPSCWLWPVLLRFVKLLRNSGRRVGVWGLSSVDCVRASCRKESSH